MEDIPETFRHRPEQIDAAAFVAPNATVLGDVILAADSSIQLTSALWRNDDTNRAYSVRIGTPPPRSFY